MCLFLSDPLVNQMRQLESAILIGNEWAMPRQVRVPFSGRLLEDMKDIVFTY